MNHWIKKICMAVTIAALLTSPVSMVSASDTTVLAKDRMDRVQKAAKANASGTFNKIEVEVPVFNSSNIANMFVTYGDGLCFYDNNYGDKSYDNTIKLKIDGEGTFYMMYEQQGGGAPSFRDSKKHKLTSMAEPTGSFYLRVKRGTYYLKISSKIKYFMFSAFVMKDNQTSLLMDDTIYQTGKNVSTVHTFRTSARAQVDVYVEALIKNKKKVSYAVQRQLNGAWKTVGSWKKKKYDIEDESATNYGLPAGTYRLLAKSSSSQGYGIGYEMTKYKTNFSKKKSKAKKITKGTTVSNMYTKSEKASRWYKYKITKKKKSIYVTFSGAANSGKFRFKVYKKKKKIKDVTVSAVGSKECKLTGAKGTYYVKVMKVGSGLNGTYYIEY